MAVPEPTPVYRRVMVFIDGGYLREGFKRIYGHDRIDFGNLREVFEKSPLTRGINPELIRSYYYDAIVDPEKDLEDYKKQKEYFSKIEEGGGYEVKLARLKRTEKRQKQKGADVNLAVDMITKAFLDQYDIAYLITGDDDFLDLVKAIKEFTDKRVYGAFYPGHISERLYLSFDKYMELTESFLDANRIPMKQEYK